MKKKYFFILFLCICQRNLSAQNVGIGITTPKARLHIADSNVVFTGPTTLSATTNFNPPLQGAGTRMMWYPQKGAFRSGVVDGTQWDKNNIGRFSFAAGNNTTALGEGATALGNGVSASAFGSVAMNFGTSASGVYSTAIGQSTIAGGNSSVAMGRFTKAFGDRSSALGDSTFASGISSVTIGVNTKAQALGSFAGGNLTIASGNYSTAMGANTTAQGDRSTAFGYFTFASGISSISMGHFTNAIGDRSIALNDSTIASGTSSAAIGFYTKAQGLASFAGGTLTTASGNYSTALGNNTTAWADQSTAFGNSTLANGISSTAMGIGSNASALGSVAMNVGTSASGVYSTAMGQSTIAGGNTSIAMGRFTKAFGDRSTALGDSTFASGTSSTAMGLNTKAKSSNSLVAGMYNDTTYANVSLFEIGNGSSNNTRRNALTVLKDGQVRIPGPEANSGLASLSIGSYGEIAIDKPGLWGGRFIIKENGYVGIGQAIPEFLLHTGYGTVRIEGPQNAVANASLWLGGFGEVRVDKPGTVGGRLMVKENGFIGINKALPAVRVDISSGNSGLSYPANTSLGIENNATHYITMLTNNGWSGIIFGNESSNTDASIEYSPVNVNPDPRTLYFRTAGSAKLKIYATGNAWLSGSLTQSSDVRMKKNIIPLSNALVSINELKGYTYNWKDEKKDTSQQIGLIAQELQKIYPQLVQQNSDGELSVNYIGLIPVLIEGMKEQQKQIEELRSEIKQLKSK